MSGSSDENKDLPHKEISVNKEDLPDLPVEEVERVLREHPEMIMEYIAMYSRSGPLPSPDELERYDSIITDGGDRIMEMWEKEQKHRHKIESNETRSKGHTILRAQVMAFTTILLVLGGGCFMVLKGHNQFGFALVGLGIVGLVTAFLKSGKLYRDDE